MGREPINKKRKNHINLSAEELFTDREEPRKAFWNLYDSMLEGQSEVMTYYGVGGIGKTSILKKLCRELEEKTSKKVMPNYAFFSFEGGAGKEDFLFSLSRQMMLWNNKLRFPLFDTALKKIAIDGGKNWDKFIEGAKETFTEHPLVDAALNIGGQFIPGIDTAAKIVDWLCTQASHKITEKEKQSGENSYLYNEIKCGDAKLLKEKLHEYFYEDVSDAMSEMNTKYVVFIDGYEKYVNAVKDSNLSNGIDNWIMEYMANISNMFLVIGGREKLNWDETILPKNQQHRIGDLSEIDATLFLNKVGIYDCELISGLYKLTNGTPAYLDICKNVFCQMPEGVKPSINDFGKDTSALVRRYLEEMDAGDLNMMVMTSYLPTVWDMPMAVQVAKKLGYEAYLDNLDKLIKLSVFEKVDKGIKIHETCRNVIREAHKDRQERIGAEIIQYLARVLLESKDSVDYMQRCMQFAEVFELCEKKVLSDEEISCIVSQIEVEVMYSSEYAKGEMLVSKLEETLHKVGYKPEIILTYKFVEANLCQKQMKYDEYHKMAVNLWDYVNEKVESLTVFHLKSAELLAVSCMNLGDYTTALSAFNYILESRQFVEEWSGENDISIIGNMAIACRELGYYEEAKKGFEIVYDDMIATYKTDNIYTLKALRDVGDIYRRLGNVEEAKKIFKYIIDALEELEVGSEHPMKLDALYLLGLIYIIMGDDERGISELEKIKEMIGVEHPFFGVVEKALNEICSQ